MVSQHSVLTIQSQMDWYQLNGITRSPYLRSELIGKLPHWATYTWHWCVNILSDARLAFAHCRCIRVCVCLCLCVRVCVRPCVCQSRACPHDNSSSMQARIIEFGQRLKTPWLRSLLLWGRWNFADKVKIDLNSKYTPFELVRTITHHVLSIY